MKKSNFQFINPYLMELYFEVNPNFSPDVDGTEVEMRNSFNKKITRNENENKANVELSLETNMQNENPPFKLKIKVASNFIWKDLDEKTIDALLNYNAPALLLGYMRPIVANVTNASVFPPYNLPFINFRE